MRPAGVAMAAIVFVSIVGGHSIIAAAGEPLVRPQVSSHPRHPQRQQREMLRSVRRRPGRPAATSAAQRSATPTSSPVSESTPTATVPVNPQCVPETCDGRDNDCDGIVDNPGPRPEYPCCPPSTAYSAGKLTVGFTETTTPSQADAIVAGLGLRKLREYDYRKYGSSVFYLVAVPVAHEYEWIDRLATYPEVANAYVGRIACVAILLPICECCRCGDILCPDLPPCAR